MKIYNNCDLELGVDLHKGHPGPGLTFTKGFQKHQNQHPLLQENIVFPLKPTLNFCKGF